MTLQVLISTVNANAKSLIKKMNINSEAIIINQCDKNDYEEITYKGHLIKVFSFKERGIGLSRNNALMRATADIVLFADDDEVLVDNYETIILDEFKKNKKADMLVFNITGNNSERKVHEINKARRLNKFNSLKYGAVRFAVNLSQIRKNNICFSLLFGGGTKYGSGEDSIFIYDCLKKKMKVFTSKSLIAKIDMSESSWFKGYNKKFYFDKGALFYALHGKLAIFFNFVYLVMHSKEKTDLKFYTRFKEMYRGYLSMKEGYSCEK